MLPVLRLGNLALIGNRKIYEFSSILNTCISTILENHNSFLVNLRVEKLLVLGFLKDEKHDSNIRFDNLFFKVVKVVLFCWKLYSDIQVALRSAAISSR